MKHNETSFSKAMGNASRKQVAGLPADRRLVKRIANTLIKLVQKNQGKEYSTPQTSKNRRHAFKAAFLTISKTQKII